MEKTWDEFWATGKVTDYLAYRDVVSDSRKNRGGETGRDNGTSSGRDGHGFDSHAY